MTGKGKATSFDIAHLVGVSQATVSRALRGSPLVNPHTRRRVQEAAAALNYKVDKNASSLRTKYSGTLALLFFEDPTADESHINPFFLSMLGSITRACARHGHDLLISFQQLSEDWHADFADSKKADGLILLGYGDYLAYIDKARKLVAQGTHFIRWGARVVGQADITVGCDNHHGGFLATAHLLAQGARRIAFLGEATPHFPEFHARHGGYLQALADAGVADDPCLLVAAESTERSGREAIENLLKNGVAFDAVFAASDLIAIGALSALNEHGLQVPQHVLLVGFDDIPMARFVNPPLTTVLQDTAQAGEILVRGLIQQIRGEPVEDVVLPTNLVVRRSSLRDAR